VDEKLDDGWRRPVMSVQAVKAVEIVNA